MTVKQAQAKCGNHAQLSCCNDVTWAGDSTDLNSGPFSGTLSNLVGTGSGAKGLGVFEKCSKLDVQVPILLNVPVQDLVNHKCKQNIACCQNSGSSAVSFYILIPSFDPHLTSSQKGDFVGVGLPCVALGSVI
ncbi:Hydrophobin [Penicillium canariense]|uniref:Hydrophobin n=1 Tax=Penicillium canariense TaxID=189055 RepID=A0A9W9IK61_9EURO|nr:Hydrophobin [Penicillium canariense]KAJ5177160.1 Hydrophobin [Penicillium canariense]